MQTQGNIGRDSMRISRDWWAVLAAAALSLRGTGRTVEQNQVREALERRFGKAGLVAWRG